MVKQSSNRSVLVSRIQIVLGALSCLEQIRSIERNPENDDGGWPIIVSRGSWTDGRLFRVKSSRVVWYLGRRVVASPTPLKEMESL